VLSQSNACSGGGHFSFGWGSGSVLAAGVPGAGAASLKGAGSGYFSGFNKQSFTYSGSMSTFGSSVNGTPTQPSNAIALGLFGGAGGNIWFSNAASANQMAGSSSTFSVDVGFIADLGIQVSVSDSGIYTVSISPPLAGLGAGLSGVQMNTNTTPGANAGCK
jgi:hypothetical protein